MAANTANIPEWINMVTTGWDTTREELLLIGERIANLRMVSFEIREGGNPAKREVPERMSGAVHTEGVPHADFCAGHRDTLEREYLEACGTGIRRPPSPVRPSWNQLGLQDLVPVYSTAIAHKARIEVQAEVRPAPRAAFAHLWLYTGEVQHRAAVRTVPAARP